MYYSLAFLFLIRVVLCLPAAAKESVELLSLTQETFKPTIASGVWLIEHFSPWCPHCRDFAPTWEKLVIQAKSDNINVSLAQVNCAVNGDLCDANKVTGYPQINIYSDGEFTETFKGAREMERLIAFITRHAPEAPVAVTTTESTLSTTSTSSTVSTTSTTLPPAEVTPNFFTQPPRRATAKKNNAGTVVKLDDATFDNTLSKGPTFVKFFAPWCGHCKKLAPKWAQLARHMAHPTSTVDLDVTIAEVNCDDHAALCKKEGVDGYPMLIYYPSEDKTDKTEYTGGRKFEQLQAFIEKAAMPSTQAVQASEFEKHLAEDEVLYLLVHTEAAQHIVAELSHAARPLLGSPPVYTSSDPALLKRFSHYLPVASHDQWALVAIKDHDTEIIHSAQVHTPDNNDSVRDWLLRNRLPTSTELTQDTFQSVMNGHTAPLVVIAAFSDATKNEIATKMHDIGLKWKIRTVAAHGVISRDVVFTWMDSVKWQKWMSNMYGISAFGDETQIVVADHGRLKYFPVDSTGQVIKMTSASIFSVLEDALAGKLSPQNSENFLERVARAFSARMTSFERYISAHPYQLVLVVVGFLVGIAVLLKRALREEGEDEYIKKGRLD